MASITWIVVNPFAIFIQFGLLAAAVIKTMEDNFYTL